MEAATAAVAMAAAADPARGLLLHRTLRVLLLVWVAVGGAALAQIAVPPLQSRITDLTGVLAADVKASMEAKLEAFEREKGSQVAVLMVPTTQPETIEQYGIRAVDAWKLGRADADDGVLLLIALEDRSLRIEVGQGLEGAIPDAVAKRIIEETIVPAFRENHFSGGIDAGLDQIIGLIRGEPLPPPQAVRSASRTTAPDRIPLFFAPLVVGMILRALLGRLPGAGLAGAGAFVLGFVLFGTMLAAGIAAAILFLIVLV
ncbi:MAG: TPM domain-containing protein, partial [Panacagrimonas sp.]